MKKIFKVSLIIGIFISSIFTIYCIDYFLAKTPIFDLPLDDALNKTSGIQTFHEEHEGTVHSGFDFKLENKTEILAPIDGMIKEINKHKMDNGYWIIDVNIYINARWYTFIAFEPWTKDKNVIDEQEKYIYVKVGDFVKKGEVIGILTPVNNSEFPHIHWNVLERPNVFSISFEDRSPYDYCSSESQKILDALCEKYDKPPSYD
ncbi:MAG: M23 family metallopeptidase [Promethearchaeia archaeon]